MWSQSCGFDRDSVSTRIRCVRQLYFSSSSYKSSLTWPHILSYRSPRPLRITHLSKCSPARSSSPHLPWWVKSPSEKTLLLRFSSCVWMKAACRLNFSNLIHSFRDAFKSVNVKRHTVLQFTFELLLQFQSFELAKRLTLILSASCVSGWLCHPVWYFLLYLYWILCA